MIRFSHEITSYSTIIYNIHSTFVKQQPIMEFTAPDQRSQFPSSTRFMPTGLPESSFLKPENLQVPFSTIENVFEGTASTPKMTQIPAEIDRRNGKSIHLASVSSSAAYLPIPSNSVRGKRESTEDVFGKSQKFVVGEHVLQTHGSPEFSVFSGLAVASELPRFPVAEQAPVLDAHSASLENTAKQPKDDLKAIEIPTFELDSLTYKDPISLVEGLAEEGKKFGAVKIKMNAAYIHERKCRLNPDSFTFKANRLLNDPRENELYHRLKFYDELIRFHTQEAKHSGVSRSISPQNDDILNESGMRIGTDSPSAQNTPAAEDVESTPMKDETEESIKNGEKAEDVTIDKTNRDFIAQSGNRGDGLPAEEKMSQRPKLPVFLTKFPMMDKRPLDLFDLFRFVTRKGGYEEVINKKLWAQIGRELGYKGKITSSLSSSLKISYAKILYPLEVHLEERVFDLTGDEFIPKQTQDSETHAGGKTNASVDEIAFHGGPSRGSTDDGLKRELGAENEAGISKKRKLNNAAPLILGSAAEFGRSLRLKASMGFLTNDPHLIDLKTPLVISVKDENADPKTKAETLITPSGASAQINNYLKWLAAYSPVIQDASRLEVGSKLATTCSLRQFIEKDARFQEYLLKEFPASFVRLGMSSIKPDERLRISAEDMERLFWRYLRESSSEFRRIENCPRLPGSLTPNGVNYHGADFANRKNQVYAGMGHVSAGHHQEVAANLRAMAGSLNPFEISNLPILPDSLLGAFTASDLANSDLVNPSLNIGSTFSTENWRCEDHFTQLCSYHSFGKPKRWYFIPESDFSKFENLLEEIIGEQNKNFRVNKNYENRCWDLDTLANFVTTDSEATGTQYECLLNSLENIVSPYPETRAKNDNEVFQRLIDLKKKKVLLNQEYFITPEMLTERGIKFTTTLQNPGEVIYKYPKTYSATVSFGFNISEEINFASKLWLDYSVEGEKWLQKQGILPSMSTFKLLINFAQLLESANSNHFSPAVHTKVSEHLAVILEAELKLRNSIRSKVKLKEVTIEERNFMESDMVTDDDLSSAIPSKIMIFSKDSGSHFVMSLASFDQYLDNDGAAEILKNLTFADLLKHPKYSTELHLFYSDEKLRSFHRSLTGYSIDFESWMARYDEMMNSEDDMVLRNYKALLQDGQKVYAALSGAQNTFDTFCQGKMLRPETLSEMDRIECFKRQVDNLKEFVEESCAVVEQCHAILSLKHQQRIRNGGTDQSDQTEDENPESLQILIELANKIPHLNFHTPEFELILEYKNEIQNFDKACRGLIESGTATMAEINDMISLGTSFGIQIPSLKFLIRLRTRLQWMETHDVIVAGGDPFSGKKEIFSLPDLKEFRDKGMAVLSNGDVDKLQTIDRFVRDGQEYEDAMQSYLSRNKILNNVNLRELESKIVDMEERSKMKGQERLFVELNTYNNLVDLKAQEKLIKFLQNFAAKTHTLHETRQILADLANCSFAYDDSHVRAHAEQSEQWLKKVEHALAQVKIINRRTKIQTVTKNVCNSKVAEIASILAENTQTAFSDERSDVFEFSSPYLFVHDLQDDFNDQIPIRYCLCRDYEDGTMIECDVCHEWFHVTCVKDISKIGDDDDRYSCPCCLVLSSYQNSSQPPAFSEKLRDTRLLALVQEGESLQVRPVAEIALLKNLCSVMEDAQKWFLQPAMRTRMESHGALYQMFLLRKLVGSPILLASIVMFLLHSLKYTDLASAFVQRVKPKTIETVEENLEEKEKENDNDCQIISESEMPKLRVAPVAPVAERVNSVPNSHDSKNVTISSPEVMTKSESVRTIKETAKPDLSEPAMQTTTEKSGSLEQSHTHVSEKGSEKGSDSIPHANHDRNPSVNEINTESFRSADCTQRQPEVSSEGAKNTPLSPSQAELAGRVPGVSDK
ncbi:hypothetical protein OXX79_005252 [Metschnikowia pulcherrima]